MNSVRTGIKAVVAAAFLVGIAFVAMSLFRGTWMVTPVLSGSMRPGFSVGGVVISERTPLRDIAVRDVIVFQNPIKRTEQMIHRIIKLTREPGGAIRIRTQGDANQVPDAWTVLIKTRDVYQIKASLPLVGYVAVAYQNYRGIFVLVAGLLLLAVPGGLWLRSRTERQAEEPDEEASELEAAGPSSTRRRPTAPAATGDGRRRSGSHASGWGLRWRKRVGGPAHFTAPARVLRSYRVAIRALTAALIAALALLGGTVYQDYRWFLVTVAGLLVLGVAASTLLTIPKRPAKPVQPEDSETPEPATVEEAAIATSMGAEDTHDHGADAVTVPERPAMPAEPEDSEAPESAPVEEPVGPGWILPEETDDSVADEELEQLGLPREPADAGAGRR